MSRPSKATPMAKKVAPPAVPEVFRHSGSSFGSAGYDSSEDGFIPLPPPDAQSNISDRSDIYGVSGKSPGPGSQFTYQSFTFPGKGIYYHHQQSLQEDQGIDLTQSPGRDSPGSSGSGSGSGSRHSTASLDSGRASGSHLLGSRAPGSTLSSSPRCSISSSSIVSSEHGGPGVRVERLMQQGIPDQDIIHAWLQDLHFEEYFALFVSAGYDMPTISKMTPEDLTAIGIKKPNPRKKLKAEIAQLNISDGLPEYIPGSMEEWLRLLRLEEYIPIFRQQGYQSVEDVTQLAWEDLEEAGVVKLGHQKRLLLAIKRVKDIRAGKVFSHLGSHTLITQAELHTPSPGSVEVPYHNTMTRSFQHHWDLDTTRQQLGYTSPYCPDIVPIKIRGGRGKSLESLEDGERMGGTHHTFSSENTGTFYYNNSNFNTGNNLQVHCGGWRRSYEDGDITPTNEAIVALHEGGGTLPRPRGLVRPRPVAKIPATRNTASHYFEKPSYNIYDMKEFNSEPLKDADLIQSDPSGDMSEKCTVPPSMPPISGIYDYKYRYSVAESNSALIHNSPIINYNTPALRRRPPSPPKRQSSHPNDLQTSLDCNTPKDNGAHQQTTIVELHAHSSVPLPNYSSPSPSSELTSQLETLHLNWRNENDQEDEQQLIAALAQVRNGSDASFKSSSSTESDSIPFANENAGTIKQRARCQGTEYAGEGRTGETQGQEPADVLSDIGNMLANLTDELDAMLEEEKRQGLNME
ncbi:ankyrin repeat-containing protein, putative [Pediculus humanus corporis]|uniref:Ankyrin repeat-containing protein, putative n=1 Tax=Pediculus humanus subsp. corporis TaxID=121224 RepID=E0VTB9_PEDHC|nr:ankyrin repeat-containing protein, putative [Pediculus humanus corporis]EEB16625.1 ankyrin repeat-containing protein, putative [Pediculus humanus corporis]